MEGEKDGMGGGRGIEGGWWRGGEKNGREGG